jgi:hypothetical protein
MTPSQRLRQQAAELIALADELDGRPGGAPMVAAVEAQERMVDTAVAEQIIGFGRTWLYEHADEFELGMKIAGRWRFYERRVRAFASGSLAARVQSVSRVLSAGGPMASDAALNHNEQEEIKNA